MRIHVLYPMITYSIYASKYRGILHGNLIDEIKEMSVRGQSHSDGPYVGIYGHGLVSLHILPTFLNFPNFLFIKTLAISSPQPA